MTTIKATKQRLTRNGEDMDQVEILGTAQGNANWGSRSGKQDAGSLKKLRTTLWPSNPTSGSIPRRTEGKVSRRYLYTQVHSGIIHNDKKDRSNPGSIGRWTDKQNVVYPYTRKQFILKRERNPFTGHSTDELWRHHAWNKPGTKGQILQDPPYLM